MAWIWVRKRAELIHATQVRINEVIFEKRQSCRDDLLIISPRWGGRLRAIFYRADAAFPQTLQRGLGEIGRLAL